MTDAAPATPTSGEPGTTLEEMMRRLDEMADAGTAGRSSSLEHLAEQASSHASALRATLDAEKEAQRMLALATKVRGEASAQAEQILLEARAAADRLREESERQVRLTRDDLAEWAAVQRRTLEQGVADVLEAARRDAEAIRADALRTAMSEAERAARRYVTGATAAGARQAEAIRAEARALLGESATMIVDSEKTLHRFGDEVGSFMHSLRRQFDAFKELSDRAQESTTTAALIGLDDLDLDADGAAPGEDGEEGEEGGAPEGAGDSGDAGDAEEADEGADAGDAGDADADADDPDQDAGAAEAAEATEDVEEPRPTRAAPPRLPHQRRPLGSLFQPPESED